jgi:hypothetical protein
MSNNVFLTKELNTMDLLVYVKKWTTKIIEEEKYQLNQYVI